MQSEEGGYVVCADEDVAFQFFLSGGGEGSGGGTGTGRLNLERFYQDDW